MSDEPTPTPEEAPPAQGFIDCCPRCRGEQQEGALQLRSDSPPSGELRIECLRCKSIHMVTIEPEGFDEDDWRSAWGQAAGR
jgi:phage FluMu protein Com